MNLGFLILADSSEAINGKVYALGAGWNELRLPSLPQEYAFSIALAVDVPWSETNRRHQLSLHVQDPDGEVIGEEFADGVRGRPAPRAASRAPTSASSSPSAPASPSPPPAPTRP